MFCPMKLIYKPKAIEPGDEALLKCEQEACAWWVKAKDGYECTINALAQWARMAYENR